MNRIYRVIWNCTLQVFQACSELTRRVGKTSTVNLRKSSGLTTKFSRLTLGVLLALSGSASGASLEVDNGQITNINTDVAYDAYLVGWYGTGVLNILAGGNASLTTITTSVIGGNEDSEGTVNVLGGTWRLYDSGNNARPLNVGQSGTGTLNIKQKGHVDGGYLRIGSSTGGVGTVNVEGEDSVLTTELFEIGSYGTGSLNITDKGYVTSSIVATVGYQANSNGKVVVEKGGEWLIKNNDSSIEFQIGNQGTGEATIREGGLITAENTIIGGNATGIGTLNVQDQDSVITVRRLYNGYFGNGKVNISNNGLINNKEYSLVGVQDGSHGVVNVTDKGHWNFLGTGEAFRYIYIGDAGDGELNVSSEGKVDSGIITAGMKETGTGNITVKDKNSVITNLGTNLGYDGHGEMNISNEGLVVSNGGSSLGYGETLSNGQNDYQGATYVQMGTLRTDADGALGNTRELNISNAAIVDLNGSAQTVETFTGLMGSTVLFKEGSLTVNKGGISQGELTGGGNLNVTGGTLAIEGLNARYNALTSISPNAEVSLDNTQGLGRGNIASDGLLTLKNVTGELRNSISGKGIVSATARTDVELDGDNSRFVGQFNIDTGSALSVNEQKNLGDASVINNGLLTIATERSWAMTHSITGSGDVTKLGTGILTLNNDSAAYQGTTDIVGGEIAFGSDSAINMASQHINIHNSGVMSGNVTTAGDVNVMPGGTLRVAKTTVGGNLENGGTVQMNSEGGKPGNVLTVNGNYTGNNGLMTFNATLGGDNSPTDKMNVKGDTQGNTRVRVDNIGGVGAQTVNGIELIEVGGNSAGNFALTTGTVEAGAYVYTLAKGKGNDEKNWYLTSKWDGVTPADTPDPINNPPVVDPEGPSVYRPEAGSYISNIAAANSLFSHRLHDRLGEPQYTDSLRVQDSATSMWMRHVGGHERFRTGDGQLNTQANRYVLQLGGDLAQWSSTQDRWHLGVMAGYANQHSNTQSNHVGYKSDGRISGYSAGLYATWYQNDANKTGAYVDSWALYNWFDNSVSSDNRSADDYDSRGVTASVEGGYTFEAGTFSGSEGTLNTWYVQPQVQITWMAVKDSDHTRKDGTRIETEGDVNVQTRLGVKTYLNSHHQRDNGKQREFQPYIEANWINNSKVYAVKMNGQTVSRDGARNLGEVRTGVEAKVNNNLSLWGNVGVQLGDKGYSDTQGMLGVKYSW
ncbi:TPA: autotransporter outer membrane beta-barrel domain-containing protein [Escherichia coli]|nr:autotransporter outer membrane beta-barrel domain-containing protein [Escherichia coli]